MEIANHTALVTGGASGLGAAVVKRVVGAGGNAVILDVQQEKGDALARELGKSALFLFTDVTNEESVNAAIARATDHFGGIHFSVNAAGTGWVERTVTKSGPHALATFEQILRLNLLGVFNVASKAAQAMSTNEPNEKSERGIIVNVASTAAFDGQIGQVAYAASKGAVVGMTLPMAPISPVSGSASSPSRRAFSIRRSWPCCPRRPSRPSTIPSRSPKGSASRRNLPCLSNKSFSTPI